MIAPLEVVILEYFLSYPLCLVLKFFYTSKTGKIVGARGEKNWNEVKGTDFVLKLDIHVVV